MFKVIIICFLIAVYYMSAITYKPDENKTTGYIKSSGKWSFVTFDEEVSKPKYFFSFYVSIGVKFNDAKNNDSKKNSNVSLSFFEN